MARPPPTPNASVRPMGPWSHNDWTRPATAAMMPAYGLYAQQQYYMNPMYMTCQQPPIAASGVKRPFEEVPKGVPVANSKDYHVLWSKTYDKPIPEEVAAKCKPLYCELCSVNLNSVIQAKMHYEGKGHDKKVRFALQAWAKDNNTVPPKKKALEKPDVSFMGPSPAQRPCYDFSYDGSQPATSQGLYCGPCDTVFTSHAHAQQHFSGRNHMRVMNGLSPLKAGYFNTRTGKWQRQPPADPALAEMSSPALPPPPSLPPPPPPPEESPTKSGDNSDQFSCTICGVTTTSQGQLDMHLNGKSHKTKASLETPNVPHSLPPKVEKPPAEKAVKKDYSIYRTPSGQYYCALCNLCVNSEQQFVQHMVSKKHKLKQSSAKAKAVTNDRASKVPKKLYRNMF